MTVRLSCRLFIAVLAGCLLLAGGCVNTLPHDEHEAAARAEEFVRAVCIDRDPEAGYDLLHPDAQTYGTRDQFAEVVRMMHANVFPAAVEAAAYLPVPGQEGMHIFLTGTNGTDTFYYRCGMAGTAAKGYRVLRFTRTQRQFPPELEKTVRPLDGE